MDITHEILTHSAESSPEWNEYLLSCTEMNVHKFWSVLFFILTGCIIDRILYMWRLYAKIILIPQYMYYTIFHTFMQISRH
jgi:hypothetical protein